MADKLFSDLNVRNNPSRNGFDLGHDCNFTAKAGELLPVFQKYMMFGDSIKFSVDHFSRTGAVNTAANVNIREYYDCFFVPFRLLWKQAPNVLASDTRNPTIASSPTSNRNIGTQMPQFDSMKVFSTVVERQEGEVSSASILSLLATMNNEFGFNRGLLANKLLNHLGYGFTTDEEFDDYYNPNNPSGNKGGLPPVSYRPYLSIMPLLAYQKIYYDFFRQTNWETNQPYNYNVDYLSSDAVVDLGQFLMLGSDSDFWQNPTMFDLRYSMYPKDLFFGLLPDSQYGEEAVVDIDGTTEGILPEFRPLTVKNSDILDIRSVSGVLTKGDVPDDFLTDTENPLGVQIHQIGQQLNASLSVLELRKANFLQKYREILGSGAVDYQNIVKKVFGVDIPDTLADHCMYLGGQSFSIKISDVVNTNLVDGAAPIIKGKGIGSGNSGMIEFTAKEPGMFMVIYHCQPVVKYALSAYHFDVMKTEVDDYPNPVFDRLGFEPFPAYYMNIDCRFVGLNDSTIATDDVGYTTRYFDHKTAIDRVLGDFRGTLSNWLAPVDLHNLWAYVSVGSGKIDINNTFFHVDPRMLDDVFTSDANSYVNTDHVHIFDRFNVQLVSNLDYKGVPY